MEAKKRWKKKILTQRKRGGDAEGAEKRGRRSQRGRGKTRRLRLPGMITAMERPSGVMAKSRKLRPCRMGMGVGWETGIS